MIPVGHRNRAFDAWYTPDELWCIEAGSQQLVEYSDSVYGGGGQASGVHGSYIAPAGWMRFALDTSKFSETGADEWQTWHKAYHGTAGANVRSIVQQGLRFMPSVHGEAGKDDDKPVIYASPSIEYSAHFVYTTKKAEKGEVQFSPAGGGAAQLDFASLAESVGGGAFLAEGSFVQWVFEVRVRPGSYRVQVCTTACKRRISLGCVLTPGAPLQGNTLGGNLWGEDGERKWRLEFEKCVNRLNLEWLIEDEGDIVCTAVMMRDIPCEPREHNRRRYEAMKEHVGWDGSRPTRPRDYGGTSGGAVRWECASLLSLVIFFC